MKFKNDVFLCFKVFFFNILLRRIWISVFFRPVLLLDKFCYKARDHIYQIKSFPKSGLGANKWSSSTIIGLSLSWYIKRQTNSLLYFLTIKKKTNFRPRRAKKIISKADFVINWRKGSTLLSRPTKILSSKLNFKHSCDKKKQYYDPLTLCSPNDNDNDDDDDEISLRYSIGLVRIRSLRIILLLTNIVWI